MCATVLLACSATAYGATRHYVLNPRSSISFVCNGCGVAPAAPEPLSGSFDVTLLPVGSLFDVAAVTNVDLSSESFSVTGNGFLQRLGRDRQAMVLDARVNEDEVLFTSGRRQPAHPGDITIVLSSPRAAEQTYVLVISASPMDNRAPDSDADRVADAADNCPGTANADQSDADGDAVGDACDQCVQTADGSLATWQGCSIEQLCPCGATTSGDAWDTQGDYLKCVARATRILRREGQISRSQSLRIIRRAARSGCGRTVIALN